jgi:hypothetical protein
MSTKSYVRLYVLLLGNFVVGVGACADARDDAMWHRHHQSILFTQCIQAHDDIRFAANDTERIEAALRYHSLAEQIDNTVESPWIRQSTQARGRRWLELILFNEDYNIIGPEGNYRVVVAHLLAQTRVRVGHFITGNPPHLTFERSNLDRIEDAEVRAAAIRDYESIPLLRRGYQVFGGN